MPFPVHRPRRLRSSESIRTLVRETRLEPSDFILPLFICAGEGIRREIGSMPGHAQLSIDRAVEECREVLSLGIGGVILFGIPVGKGRRSHRERTPTTASCSVRSGRSSARFRSCWS